MRRRPTADDLDVFTEMAAIDLSVRPRFVESQFTEEIARVQSEGGMPFRKRSSSARDQGDAQCRQQGRKRKEANVSLQRNSRPPSKRLTNGPTRIDRRHPLINDVAETRSRRKAL